MTDEEIIAVVTAHKEGKTIEIANKGQSDWEIAISPCWNFDYWDYRVKPEPHYRPFKSAEEVMEAIEEHGDWVKRESDIERVFSFNNNTVNMTYSNLCYSDAFEMYSFIDNTPFDKLEE